MKIVFIALHSKYVHNSLALPCLAAACRDIDGVDSVIREFTINEDPGDVAASISEEGADLLAFSCYIWNTLQILDLAEVMKRARPELIIILGGPEVSYDAPHVLEKNTAVDCIIKGEGESVLRNVIEALQNDRTMESIPGTATRSAAGIVDNRPAIPMPDLDTIPSPFAAGLADLSKPCVYYESSRGCPFSCAFCLSSLDRQVRSFSMDRIRSDLCHLMAGSVKTVKFVDRTFNFNAKRANEIWRFILENNKGSKFHFEIAADLLTDENIDLLKEVPPGVFRFEIGVQSIVEETLERVGRNSDMARLFANVKRLMMETSIHLHLDLVAGLPEENFDGFERSLQRIFELRPPHIQVEPLKILKGSPMETIAGEEGYLYSSRPPYRIETTPWLSRDEIEVIERIGYLLERIYNSGRFEATVKVLEKEGPLSIFFSGMARWWIDNSLATLSLEELFEAVWTFGRSLLPGGAHPDLADALTFDRLKADFPNLKKLPSYFNNDDGAGFGYNRSANRAARQKLAIPEDHKLRIFGWHFMHDYPVEGGLYARDLLFAYSAPFGARQRVKIVSVSALDP